jgi:hypothetical protein
MRSWVRILSIQHCFRSILAWLQQFHVGFKSWLMAAKMTDRNIYFKRILRTQERYHQKDVTVLSPFYALFRRILFTSIIYISFVYFWLSIPFEVGFWFHSNENSGTWSCGCTIENRFELRILWNIFQRTTRQREQTIGRSLYRSVIASMIFMMSQPLNTLN